ncbi:MAG: cysteine hydrolase [Deltaproteobacteria bacterium]|nr:cysteine hydrolase [Deltaproteobacteria bacterium]MBM4299260.1 cysteine hydrolase [Deltaproteobacteria bacterium]
MLEFEGRQIPTELREIADPRRTVLLVWDMQNDQAGGSFNKDALIRNAPPLIAAAANAGIKTVYTRQTPFLWKEEAVTWIRRAMINEKVDHPSKLKPRRLRGSKNWEIMEPFKPAPDDIVIDKRRPSMFVGNEFETIMHNVVATTVVMIGCTTDGGVEMTVRDGHNRGHLMVVVRDCVGTYTEEGHNAALKRIEKFADVVDSQELISIWQR